jgi:hypothetical protein
MPITYSLKLGGKLIHAVGEGVITTRDLKEFLAAQSQDKRIKPGMLALGDLRQVTDDSQVTTAGIWEFVKSQKLKTDTFRARKRALLVSRESIEATCFVVEALTNLEEVQIESKIFYNLDDACQWLGIDAQSL